MKKIAVDQCFFAFLLGIPGIYVIHVLLVCTLQVGPTSRTYIVTVESVVGQGSRTGPTR